MSRCRARATALAARRGTPGFTLVELLIAVLVLGVLVSVALPSFLDSLRKSRRSEALTALGTLQQAQERWRSNNPSYTAQLGTSGLRLTTATSATSYATPSNYYTIAVTAADATSYVATATPVSGSSQAADSQCTLFVVALQGGGNLSYGSNSATLPLSDANRCWAR